MSKPPPPAYKRSPADRFKPQIEAALAEGADRERMVLHLTLRDVQQLTRDKATPVSDISFVGGEMRYLGVRIEKGGVATSALSRGED